MLAGFRVNSHRGDALRADLYRKTERVLDHLDVLGAHTPNVSGAPIVEIPLGDADDLEVVGTPVGRRHLRHARRVPPGATAPAQCRARRDPWML